MFAATRRITLRDADPAGVLFFARYLTFAHDVCEEYLMTRGADYRRTLEQAGCYLPVIHSECDYRQALIIGDTVTIRMRLAEFKNYSYTLAYEFVAPDGTVAATAKLVHAAVSRTTRKLAPIPEPVLTALKTLPAEDVPA